MCVCLLAPLDALLPGFLLAFVLASSLDYGNPLRFVDAP
jgi:hypothetical protein